MIYCYNDYFFSTVIGSSLSCIDLLVTEEKVENAFQYRCTSGVGPSHHHKEILLHVTTSSIEAV